MSNDGVQTSRAIGTCLDQRL